MCSSRASREARDVQCVSTRQSASSRDPFDRREMGSPRPRPHSHALRSTFNSLWSEGMAELTEQVHLENPLLGLPDGAEPPPPVR